MVYFSDASMGRSAMPHANFGNCLGIYYQNVRGLRTKQLEFYDNLCASNFDIIYLSETWLNDLCYNHNLFPNRYTVYWSDRPYINKAHGGGILTAITASLGSCSCRYDLDLCSEYVWVEIPTADCISILIGNHYFPPDTKPEVIIDYLRHPENTLDTNKTRIILLGDFNAPGFNWESGTPLSKCHYYSKLKGDAIYTSTCLLGPRQCAEAIDSLNMLDLVFANFTDLKSVPAHSGLVTPDTYHPPLSIDVFCPTLIII
jgi:hypothetical protein